MLAGILEAAWAVGLKYTDGFSRPRPSLLVALAIIASMFLLSLAVRTIPISTGYPIWVGIGILGTAISGPLIFGEAFRPIQLLFLAMLVAAIIGLKLTCHQK